MQRPIRILHLEHHSDSAKLAQLRLQAQGVACDLLRIENRADFEVSLPNQWLYDPCRYKVTGELLTLAIYASGFSRTFGRFQ